MDLLGLGVSSPFPGASLGRFWRNRSENADLSQETDAVVSELRLPNPQSPNQGRSDYFQGPLTSLAIDQYVYIRSDHDGSGQLIDHRSDPDESSDQSHNELMRPILENFRRRFDQFRKTSAPFQKDTVGLIAWRSFTDDRIVEEVLTGSLFGGSARSGVGLRIQWSVKNPFPRHLPARHVAIDTVRGGRDRASFLCLR